MFNYSLGEYKNEATIWPIYDHYVWNLQSHTDTLGTPIFKPIIYCQFSHRTQAIAIFRAMHDFFGGNFDPINQSHVRTPRYGNGRSPSKSADGDVVAKATILRNIHEKEWGYMIRMAHH